RPLSRTIFVLAAVSSINTSRVELSMPCRRFQDRRARATSGRSCSAARRLFFKADFMALDEFPYGSAHASNPMLVHAPAHFVQGQLGLLYNECEQPRRVRPHWGGAAARRLGCATSSLAKALHPFHCRAWTDVEQLGCLTTRGPAFHACNHPHANIRRVCLRHGQ